MSDLDQFPCRLLPFRMVHLDKQLAVGLDRSRNGIAQRAADPNYRD